MLKTGVRFNIFLENAMHLESLNTYLKYIFYNNVKKSLLFLLINLMHPCLIKCLNFLTEKKISLLMHVWMRVCILI